MNLIRFICFLPRLLILMFLRHAHSCQAVNFVGLKPRLAKSNPRFTNMQEHYVKLANLVRKQHNFEFKPTLTGKNLLIKHNGQALKALVPLQEELNSHFSVSNQYNINASYIFVTHIINTAETSEEKRMKYDLLTIAGILDCDMHNIHARAHLPLYPSEELKNTISKRHDFLKDLLENKELFTLSLSSLAHKYTTSKECMHLRYVPYGACTLKSKDVAAFCMELMFDPTRAFHYQNLDMTTKLLISAALKSKLQDFIAQNSLSYENSSSFEEDDSSQGFDASELSDSLDSDESDDESVMQADILFTNIDTLEIYQPSASPDKEITITTEPGLEKSEKPRKKKVFSRVK